MAKKKKRRKKPLGPCPDPLRYSLVRSKDGDYWRLNRGLKKAAELNESLDRNSENFKITSPLSSKLVRLLEPHLRGLKTGRLGVRINGKLVKCLNKTGKMDLSALKGLEFQEDYPLNSLLNANFNIIQDKHTISVRLNIGPEPVEKHNELVTECFFDLILVSGDLQKPRSLRIDSTTSPLFKVYTSYKIKHVDCVLSLDMPLKRSWILLLKVSCLEGNEMAVHPRNYALEIIGASGPPDFLT